MMGLSHFLQKAYLSKFKAAPKFKELSDLKIVPLVFKFKVISFGLIVIALASFLFLISRAIYLKGVSWPEVHLSLIIFASCGLLVYLHKTLNVVRANLIFNALWLVNLPIRVAMTGGLMSPLLAGYLGHSIYVYCLCGPKWGNLSIFWSAVSIGFFTFIDPFYSFEGALLTDHPEFQTLLGIITIFFIGLPIVFMFDEKRELESSLRRMQKQSDSFIVMLRLNHEIGNSLHKALGFLQIIKAKKELMMLENVREPLEEIREVGEALSKLAVEGDLAKYLKEHKDDIKILEKLQNEVI